MTFKLEQAGDLSHHEVSRNQSPALAQGRIIFRLQEGFDGKAAEDAGELFGTTNSSRKKLFRHRIGDAHKMGRAPAGVTLSHPEEAVRGRALEKAKGWAVNRMNDGGHSCPPRRQPAQNAGFAAMGVYQVG